MRVTILGAGTAIPAARHSPSGIYVQAAGQRLLLDAGPGTVQRLHGAGVSPCELDRIFLTHYHIDHCLDLVSLLFALRLPRPARCKPLTIYGPRGLNGLYRRLNTAFHGWLAPRTYRLTLRELAAGSSPLTRGLQVRALAMRHSAPALGYRLRAAGKTLAYSGDTDAAPNVVALGRGADVFILECSIPDEQKVAGHLTPSECGRIAAAAGCRHLVLTHFYPVFHGYDIRGRVRRFFRGRLTLAHDLLAIRV